MSAKWAKIRIKKSFFAIFSGLVLSFSFKLRRMIAWNNVLLVAVKFMKKLGGPN